MAVSRRIPYFLTGAFAALCVLAGCSSAAPDRVQGYIEGEFVYVSSPLPGKLEALYTQRGAQVRAGDPLFALESVSEKAAREEAEQRLAQARANLEDAKKGKRPSEIQSIEAPASAGNTLIFRKRARPAGETAAVQRDRCTGR